MNTLRIVRRVTRVVAWVLLSIVTLALALVTGAILLARSDTGRRKLLSTVLEQARARLAGELTIGRLSGDLTRTLVLEDVELRDVEGKPAVRARRIALRFNLLALTRHEVRVEDAELEGAWVHARPLENGTLNLAQLTRPSPKTTAPRPSAWSVVVKKVHAAGSARYDQPERRVSARLLVDGGFRYQGETVDVRVDRLDVFADQPARAEAHAHGTAHVIRGLPTLDGVEVSVAAEAGELDRLAPALALRGSWRVKASANGPLSGMDVHVVASAPRGEISVTARTHLAPGKPPAEMGWDASARVHGLDPGAAWRGAPHGRVEIEATGAGQGKKGKVFVQRFLADVAGAHASAHGQAQLGGDLSAEAWLDVSARDLSRLATLGAPALDGRLDLHAHIRHSEHHTDVDADVQAMRVAVAAARIERLDAHVHTRNLRGRALLAARGVRAGGIRIDALQVAASGDRQAIALQLEATGPHGDAVALNLHGKPVPGDQLGADLTLDRLLVALRGQKWEMPRPGWLRVDEHTVAIDLPLHSGAQQLHLGGRLDRDRETVAATLSARGLDAALLALLAPTPVRAPRTAIDIDARVDGPLRSPVAHASLKGSVARDPHLGIDRVDLTLDAEYARERLKASLAAVSAGQQLSARVDAPVSLLPTKPVRVEVRATGVRLEKLSRLLPPRLAALRGRGELTAKVSGTTRRPQLEATLDLPAWDLPPLKKSGARVQISYVGTELRVEATARLVAEKRPLAGERRLLPTPTVPAGTIHLTGRAPIDLSRSTTTRRLLERLEHETPLDLRVDASGLDIEHLPLGALGIRVPLRSGRVDLTAQASGNLHRPKVRAELRATEVAARSLDHVGVQARLVYEGGRARADLDASLRGAPLLHARAEAELDARKLVDGGPWKEGALRADVKIGPYDLSKLTRPGSLTGTLKGTLAARGTLAHPTARADLDVDGLRLGATTFKRLALDGEYDGTRAVVRLDGAEQSGGTVRLDAKIPVGAAAGPLALSFRARALDLDVTNLGALKRLKIRLEAQLDASGTLSAPRLSGYAKIDDGLWGFAADSRLYEHLQLDVALADGVVQLKKAAVSVQGGGLRASGTAKLDGLTPTAVDLTAEAHHFPVVAGAAAAWLDARVDVRGQRQNGALRGDLIVRTATAHLPKLATGKKLQSTGPLEDVVYVDEAAQRQRAARERAARETGPIEMKAHIPGPLQIRSPEMQADLKGELDVEVAAGVPKITGNVEATWGWIDLLGRRYQIERAGISFSGEPDPNPALDIRVTREVGDADVIIEVHGTARRPKLELSSDPPIYDQSQIVGIIISGDPGSKRISDKSTDAKVVGAISGLVVGKIKDQIAPMLPIDVLKVDSAGSDAAGVGQTRLEIGKYLTDNLYVSYVHQFGTVSGTRRTNSNQATVDWHFKKRYSLDTMFGDAGQGSIDLFWTLRY